MKLKSISWLTRFDKNERLIKMPIQKKEVSYAKELDDVLALVVHIVQEAKAGKPASEIASGAVAKLIDALAGLDQLDDEFSANRAAVMSTVALRLGDVVDTVLGKAIVNPILPA